MLHVNLYIAVLAYFGIITIFIIGIWMWIEFNAHSGNLGGSIQRKWRCNYCGYMYLGPGEENLSQCPRCESYNEM
jgi:hypothetical protein